MTKDQVKSILNIASTQYDDYLTAVVPLLEEWVQTKCNNQTMTAGMMLFVAKAAEYNLQAAGVSAESLGDHSVSIAQDYPPSIMRLLEGSQQVKFV